MDISFDNLVAKLDSWTDQIVLMIPNILLAIITLAIFYFISRLVKKWVFKLTQRFSDNIAVNRLLANTVAILVGVLGLILILKILKLDQAITSVLAGAGIVGLAIGIAFQEPILNIFSGVSIAVRRSFNVGDIIKTSSHEGIITEINLRVTRIKTFTGEDVFIPNKMIVQNPVENYTLTSERRVDITCGVAYDSNLDQVKSVAIQSIKERVDYDTSKPIEFYYNEFGDSSINFTLRYWIKTAHQKPYLALRSDGIQAIKKAFSDNGINIPFPIRTIQIQK